MDDNKTLFFLSGFFSLSLLFLILFLFIYMMFSSNVNKSFALKKDTFISVSIQIPTKTIKQTEISKTLSPTIAPSIPSPIKNSNVDIDDLFSDVWTKKITKKKLKKKEINNQRIKEIQKKIIIKKDKSNQINTKNISDLFKSADKKNSKVSTANEVNEYLAKIQAIVYNHFIPPANSQGFTVKAVIELSALGKMLDFRIIRYSSNQALNKECDKIKDRLTGVLFPINPNNKSLIQQINITSDKN